MKILIRLPNWLGDVVMSTGFVDAVMQFYPGARVDVIIKKELAQLAMLIPGLHTIHPFSKKEYKGLRGVYRFGKQLQTEKYDLFFNLPISLSSMVMARATGAKKRIGFENAGSFFLLSNFYKKPVNAHRVDEYISLIEQFTGKTLTNRSVRLGDNQVAQPNTNRVLINFNSEADSRRMPVDKAKSIINLLTHTFEKTSFTFIGAPKEAAFVEELMDGAANGSRLENLAGKTDLGGLVNLMASSAAILTTDSGPAHLANSAGTPTIVLFGAGNEHNTAPYNRGNLTIIRYGGLPCEPCIKNTCKLYGVPKCMEMLDEWRIVDALKQYLYLK